MSFPRYESYKDTRVEWLGEVPEHWKVTRLRYITECLDGKRIPLNSEQRAEKKGNVPYWGANSIVDYVDEALFDEVLVLLGEDGAPFFDRSKPVAFYSIGKVWPNNHVHVLRPPGVVAGKFITYCLNITDFANFIDGSTRDKLTQNQMNNIPIPWPSNIEQQTIAAFLDRETAKIDELITEQQRLIELLKEKRQAVISHAVTKGLNPDAPMKDSGIEWLGEVPAHWEICALKRVASIRYGIGEPPQYQAEGTPLIRATNVHNGRISEDGLVFVNPTDIPEKRIVWLLAGDIIVVRSGAYTGDSAIIPYGYGQCIAGFDMVLRCNGVSPNFLQFSLLSKYLKEGQIDLEKTRAAQPHLNAEELGNCIIVFPLEKEEQTKVTTFLDQETTKLDTLTAEAKRTITLLQERRTALISAAVTGKIDVRVIVAVQPQTEVAA
jgi:type I restriction enzyme S subunit